MKRKILHLLQWRFNDIAIHAGKIKEQGFNAVQVGPVQPTKDTGFEWWKLYQPCDFLIGNTQLGTREEFKMMCDRLHIFGIKVYVDIVLRHVAGADNGDLVPHFNVNSYFRHNYLNAPCNNYHNRDEYTSKCTGMPMIDYTKQYIQENFYIPFLDYLVTCGVDGFRLDQAKHFKLPEEGCNFFHIFDKFKDKFIYGEVIFEDKSLLDKYTKYINVITEGRPSNLDKLVAFFESHDSYHEFKYTQALTRQQIIDEWRILNKDCNFKNTIFFARPMNAIYTDSWTWKEIKDINNSTY